MPSPPTAPNTHEVARAVHADARVAYVDNDPIVISHLNLLAADGNLGVAAVDGNVRDVSGILTRVSASIDLSERDSVMIVGIARVG